LVHALGLDAPDLFDTAVTNIDMFNIPELHKVNGTGSYLPLTNQLCDYQAILNIGSNIDWAERLRQSFYGNAVVVLPEHAPHEFFNSFMEPYKAYWPVASDLSNLEEKVSSIMNLENLTEQLSGQKRFATTILNEKFMILYNRILIQEYDRRVKSRMNRTKAEAEEAASAARRVLGVTRPPGCGSGGIRRICPAGEGPA